MHVPHGGAGVYVSAQPSTSSGTPERLRTGGAVGVKEGGRACRRPESWREKSAANLRAANQSTRTSAHCARSSGGRLVDIRGVRGAPGGRADCLTLYKYS